MPVLHIAYEKLSNGQFNFTMGVFLFRLNYQLGLVQFTVFFTIQGRDELF